MWSYRDVANRHASQRDDADGPLVFGAEFIKGLILLCAVVLDSLANPLERGGRPARRHYGRRIRNGRLHQGEEDRWA